MTPADKTTESEVRSMRDRVYGQPIWDSESVKANWMRPDSVRWLREQIALDEAKTTPPAAGPGEMTTFLVSKP